MVTLRRLRYLLPSSLAQLNQAEILQHAESGVVLYSEAFDDGEKLLAECEKRGLEGIVSKRKVQPYRCGRGDWIKVNTKVWREANMNHGDLFRTKS